MPDTTASRPESRHPVLTWTAALLPRRNTRILLVRSRRPEGSAMRCPLWRVNGDRPRARRGDRDAARHLEARRPG